MTKNAPAGQIDLNIGRSIMPNGTKFANQIMFAVKGHLIPEQYNQSDIDHMEDQYIKRLWGNCEALPNSLERFEKAWREANG